MLIEGSKIWLFVSDLTEFVSLETIKSGLQRNKRGDIPSWKHKSLDTDKRVKLIDYDFLPESTKSKLPSREDIIKNHEVENLENRLVVETNAKL